MIPQRELVEDCALEHAIDFEKLNECATKDNGAYGVDLLRQSVARSSSVSHKIVEPKREMYLTDCLGGRYKELHGPTER